MPVWGAGVVKLIGYLEPDFFPIRNKLIVISTYPQIESILPTRLFISYRL